MLYENTNVFQSKGEILLEINILKLVSYIQKGWIIVKLHGYKESRARYLNDK